MSVSRDFIVSDSGWGDFVNGERVLIGVLGLLALAAEVPFGCAGVAGALRRAMASVSRVERLVVSVVSRVHGWRG